MPLPEWGLLKGALSLTLDLTRLGHMRILVELRDVDAAYDAHLTFLFDADQTYLPLWMDQIAEAMQQFFQEP